jgi:hypothetical protein
MVNAVHDTVVRVAAPPTHEVPTWALTVITAIAAVVAGITAQWFRVLLDDNRRREQIRQVLLIEVAVLRVYLRRIRDLAIAWQLPPRRGFWLQLDNAMRGYDELHTALPLLPADVRVPLTAWFLKLKEIRLGAEGLAQEYAREHASGQLAEPTKKEFERLFERLERDATFELEQANSVYKSLFEAIPKRWIRHIGAGIEQRYRSLDDAEKAAENLGLTPKA